MPGAKCFAKTLVWTSATPVADPSLKATSFKSTGMGSIGAPSYAVDEWTPAAGPEWTQSIRKWVAGPTQITLLATPSIKPINIGREPSEHGVIVFYSSSTLAN